MLIKERQAVVLVAIMAAVPALPGAFVLAGILQGPQPQGMMRDLVNPHYFVQPTAISLHIFAGILFGVLAPLQFVARLRRNAWHRIAGRIAMLAGLIFGLSVFAIMGPIPADFVGWVSYLGLGLSGLGVSGSLVASLWSIRRRNIAAHRIWMLCAIAIGLMGASRILFDVILALVLPDQAELNGGLSIWFAASFNLLLVAWFNTRKPAQVQAKQKARR